ncbi:TPA: hypothetical protein ACXIJH_004911 [Serratia marcescens]
MSELTERQAQVLAFIRQFLRENGSAPTQREIADAIGCASANAVALHLKALERKGAITTKTGRSRGIVLNDRVPDFDTWLQGQTVPIEVDCGCVTTEVLLFWIKKAYNDGLLAGAGRTEVTK